AETGRPDVNAETVKNVLLLERMFGRARLGPRRLRVRVEEGAGHTESAWAARLPEALEFLFG
nr:esterase [Acidobacteriota bacterium]